MPQKSRSRSTLTQKNEEKYQRNKEKQEKKKKPWAATTICSKFTFFSVLLPDKALIKTAMCSVKTCAGPGHFFLPHIHSHNGFTVPTYSHDHTNIPCHVLLFLKDAAELAGKKKNIHKEDSECIHTCLCYNNKTGKINK